MRWFILKVEYIKLPLPFRYAEFLLGAETRVVKLKITSLMYRTQHLLLVH